MMQEYDVDHLRLSMVAMMAFACPSLLAERSGPAADPIQARIDAIRPIAAAIIIDGRDEDWAGIPSFTDERDDSGDDPSRDIVETAIAPLGEALLVRIRTAGRPSPEASTFWINVDLWGRQTVDFQIGITGYTTNHFWIFEGGVASKYTTIRDLQVAIDDVVEMRLPLTALQEIYDRNDVPFPPDALDRRWVRVFPFTWNHAAQQYVDFGAAAGSFKLIDGSAGRLAKPRPQPGAALIDLPLNGRCYVSSDSQEGRPTEYSYILDQRNHIGYPARRPGSNDVRDYGGWDQPVFSPVAGPVLRVRSDVPDNLPGEATIRPPNLLVVDLGDGTALSMKHLRQDSVQVKAGSSVILHEPLGRLGQSGATTWPHLHLDRWKLPEETPRLPIAFRNVRVGLNHTADDPWSVDVESWPVEEGFFVERLEPAPSPRQSGPRL